MRPRMGGDLVTLGNHTSDNGRVRGGNIDLTFTKVVPGYEESGGEVEARQHVQ